MAAQSTVEEAFALLHQLGAPPRLIHHAQTVESVARDLLPPLQSWGVRLDANLVRVGAVLHDAGKIVHPEELEKPGHLHEHAGRSLLLEAGYPYAIASVCIRHASWQDHDLALEFLLIALADKLWKGKRESGLETLIIGKVSEATRKPEWDIFQQLDSIFEDIASEGDRLLLESQRFSITP